MTLTLELPETLAERFTPLPEEERKRYAIELIEEGLSRNGYVIDDREGVAPMSQEDIAAVNRGIDDLFAGRHRPFEEFVAEREAFWKKRGVDLKNAR